MNRLVPLFVLLSFLLSACSTPTGRAEPRPLTYVALGASDAVGVGARDPERESYVNRPGGAHAARLESG